MIKRNFTKTAAFFLFLFSLNLLISCSSDDSSGTATGTESSISYKVNGQTFNCNIVGSAVDEFDRLTISGGFNNDSNNSLSFRGYNDEVGADAIFNAIIIFNGNSYNNFGQSNFLSNVIINNTEKVQGTFSGTLVNDNSQTITITEGQFEIFKD